jgi:hypothetical protein
MKIGFSFGRCLRSIVLGEVQYDDVLCIIARTFMQTEEHVAGVIDAYLDRGYLHGLDRTTCQQVGLQLFNSGKILEPRANGVNPMSVPKDYVWMDLFPTISDARSTAVQEAWNHYRLLINLTEQLPEEGFVPAHGRKIHEREVEELKVAAEILANSI